MRLTRSRNRPSRRPVPGVPALDELDHLADDAMAVAEQIKRTVAELRRQADDDTGAEHDQ